VVLALLPFFGWGAQAQAPAGKTKDSDLAAEFDQAVKVFMDEYRAADEKAREAMLADPVREPRHRFTPLFRAAAERHRGTPEALAYWAWLVDNGSIVDRQVGGLAVRRLLADHLADPALAPAAGAIGRAADRRGVEKTIADLTRIVDRSPHAEVRAEALYQRALLRRKAGSKEARKDFERAAAEAPTSSAGRRAAEEVEALSVLGLGDPAPELAGKNLDGKPVTLAGLRGRVVLVDFWGMWCGPCVAQLPKLKELGRQFEGQPFDILGVNSDPEIERLRQFLSTNQIDWTQVLDYGSAGPIAHAWRINAWPASFLIDPKGVIRGVNLDFDALAAQIAGLLKKL
jgi:thiol-disulfide isomerase/thioredoxin